ncbi:MAG: hypothetical protein ABFD90_16335 [Phycisphaerales bacterium]
MEKNRTAVSLLLLAIGAALLIYGLSSRATVVSSDEPNQVSAPSGLPATQAVANDGVAQETPSQARKPEEEAKKAPAACPT